MTNEERVAVLLAEEHIGPCAQIARRMAEAGLIAPDPPPRYKEYPCAIRGTAIQHFIGGGVALFYVTEHASTEEREAVLAALNALPDEGETP